MIGGLVVATVILVALGGVYLLVSGPGAAIAQGDIVQVDALAECCCQEPDGTIITVPATTTLSDPNVDYSCQQVCGDKRIQTVGVCGTI